MTNVRTNFNPNLSDYQMLKKSFDSQGNNKQFYIECTIFPKKHPPDGKLIPIPRGLVTIFLLNVCYRRASAILPTTAVVTFCFAAFMAVFSKDITVFTSSSSNQILRSANFRHTYWLFQFSSLI